MRARHGLNGANREQRYWIRRIMAVSRPESHAAALANPVWTWDAVTSTNDLRVALCLAGEDPPRLAELNAITGHDMRPRETVPTQLTLELAS